MHSEERIQWCPMRRKPLSPHTEELDAEAAGPEVEDAYEECESAGGGPRSEKCGDAKVATTWSRVSLALAMARAHKREEGQQHVLGQCGSSCAEVAE